MAIAGGELNWLEEANTNRTLGIYDVELNKKMRHHYGHPVEPMRVETMPFSNTLLFVSTDVLYTLNLKNLEINQLKLEQTSRNFHKEFKSVMLFDSLGKLHVKGVISKCMETEVENTNLIGT